MAPLIISLLVGVVCLLAVPFTSSLTVHLVPHTHDDVGWLKTVDQYFIGSNNSLQHAAVTNLITATIAALKRNPERKFIYVEQAFFQRWWRQQNDAMKATVRSMVASGQFEFINGGWCMHDEATTHYVDMIDQTTLGHQYIVQEFGEAANPTIGWQVDPFGHSATQPSLLGHEVGFDALFFGRIDYQDHDWRVRAKEMQFSWAPSPSLGPTSQVWTEVALDGNYNPPAGFCWDYLCGNEGVNTQVQDRDDLEDNNAREKVAAFIRAANTYAATRKGDYATMNIQWNMGSDFNYESAERYFINMDKIIAAVNRNGSIHAQYSTPSLYYKAKMAEGIQWSTKTDDFFPYASGRGNEWTGYFTSRPGVKGYVRSSSITLQTARQLEVFAGGDGTGTEAAWEAIAVAQHHDAVSGTERQHVAYDYTQRIAKGMAVAYRTLDSALSRLAANGSTVVNFASCPLLNVSVCEVISSSNGYTVLLYNPQPRESGVSVRLPLSSSGAVQVQDSTGATLPSEVVPVPRTSAHTAASLAYEVVVTPTVPGLGYVTLFVHTSGAAHASARMRGLKAAAAPVMQVPRAATVSIESTAVRLTFDNTTGLVQSWTDLQSGDVHPFTQDFLYYEASANNSLGVSNLYRFQPLGQLNKISDSAVQLTVFQGQQVQMVHQRWNDWLSQTWRLYNDSRYPELQWVVGPIDFSNNHSREVVTRYTTDIQSQGELWTDANGREFQRRVRDQRPSFNRTLVDPIASNYYPITTSVKLNDSERAFGVLVDRAEGTASLQDGAIEVMLHRRLLALSDFENLNETDGAVYRDGTLVERLGRGLIVTGVHHLVLGTPAQVTTALRRGQDHVYHPLHPVFSATSDTAVTWRAQSRVGQASFLQTALPPTVELMSLHYLFDGSVLLRLAHLMAVGEPGAEAVTVDLSTLFAQPVKSITQKTLTANADYKAGKRERLPYKTDREISDAEWERIDRLHDGLQDTSITLQPMQIVAFAITF